MATDLIAMHLENNGVGKPFYLSKEQGHSPTHPHTYNYIWMFFCLSLTVAVLLGIHG